MTAAAVTPITTTTARDEKMETPVLLGKQEADKNPFEVFLKLLQGGFCHPKSPQQKQKKHKLSRGMSNTKDAATMETADADSMDELDENDSLIGTTTEYFVGNQCAFVAPEGMEVTTSTTAATTPTPTEQADSKQAKESLTAQDDKEEEEEESSSMASSTCEEEDGNNTDGIVTKEVAVVTTAPGNRRARVQAGIETLVFHLTIVLFTMYMLRKAGFAPQFSLDYSK